MIAKSDTEGSIKCKLQIIVGRTQWMSVHLVSYDTILRLYEVVEGHLQRCVRAQKVRKNERDV
jgi:hypothetical protein